MSVLRSSYTAQAEVKTTNSSIHYGNGYNNVFERQKFPWSMSYHCRQLDANSPPYITRDDLTLRHFTKGIQMKAEKKTPKDVRKQNLAHLQRSSATGDDGEVERNMVE